MLKHFYVFRHGETDWNKARRLQGHTDIPLNEQGREQARCLQDLLAWGLKEKQPTSLSNSIDRLAPEVFLTSDLSRAFETARIANEKLGVPLFVDLRLRECDLGQAEGLLRSEISDRFGMDLFNRWLSIEPADIDFSFPGGESKQAHLLRLVGCLEEFAYGSLSSKSHDLSSIGGQIDSALFEKSFSNIAVATHGGCLRRLIHHCAGAPPEPAYIPNCVLYHLTFDIVSGEWRYVDMIG